MEAQAAQSQPSSAPTPRSLAAELARLDERDVGIIRELQLMREELARIEARVWLLATGGIGAGALGGVVVALANTIGGP